MKRPVSIIMLLAGICLLFAACRKEQPQGPDASLVAFAISQPLPDSVYAPGRAIPIEVQVSAPYELHGYKLALLRMPGAVPVFEAEAHAHGRQIQISESWVHNLPEASELELLIRVTIDHEGHEAEKRIVLQAGD